MLGFPLQQSCVCIEAGSTKCHEDDEGNGGAGTVQPGEGEVWRALIALYKYLMGGGGGVKKTNRLFSVVSSERTRDSGHYLEWNSILM